MNRSAGSIMDNIAEGFGRNGDKEFIQFLSFSKGSCVELKSQLYRALDRCYFENNEFITVYEKINQVEKMNSKLIEYLRKSSFKGWKY
jgi:four helix bundle protein